MIGTCTMCGAKNPYGNCCKDCAINDMTEEEIARHFPEEEIDKAEYLYAK